jgi:hypothetical protein
MGIGRGGVNENLLPHGESLRNAVRWLSSQLEAGEVLSLKLIEEAALRFDLSPVEEEFLRTHFTQKADP